MSTAGTAFGRYRVEAQIGRGGMGVVYRATDTVLQRPVALKLIAPELAEDIQFRRRFLRESQLAASLDHPNVIPIYEAGEDRGQLFIAMRFVEGEDLATILGREIALPLERTLALLSQVAGALDAAHEHALVHRDVKPSNVLVDAKDHVYLTDFGVTKQLGGDSTETGGIVGTLDYLAPEQIDGAGVDARTDVYALGCVLYECLAGRPPFRRETEGETLWAHMRAEYAPLTEHPPLDPVFERAFARDRDDRYSSCGALIEAARTAKTRVPVGLLRRRRAILAAGAVGLAATIALAAVTTMRDGAAAEGVVGSGMAAVDADGKLASFTRMEAAPGIVAVGEGAVWTLDSESETVSQLDPANGNVVKRFSPAERPTNLAAGAGALWIGSAGPKDGDQGLMRIVSRIDPGSGKRTGTALLSEDSTPHGAVVAEGLPQIAVGAGAVWAVGPDDAVYRLDPETARVVKRISTGPRPSTIAAGQEGVWFINYANTKVARIDPVTNRVAEEIEIESDFLQGIAVGAGYVWTTSTQDGLLYRVEPGPRPLSRSIDVGIGVSFVAFGDGAVWTGNYNRDGTVTRVDPRTGTVTDRIALGAPQAIAAGEGAAWVSATAGTRDGTLPAAVCSEVAAGGRTPDVVIASDFELQDASPIPRALAESIRFVLREHDHRAGRFTVGYQSCDNSTAQSRVHEQRKCAANANAMAAAPAVVAVIGGMQSYCAAVEIPILNRASGGPVAFLGPSTSRPALTRGGERVVTSFGMRGAPDVFYPTGTRNFFRVIARDDLMGTALALHAQQLGLRNVYLLHDSAPFSRANVTDPFRSAADRLDIGIAGEQPFDVEARHYGRLAAQVARSDPDGVVIGGSVHLGGDRLLSTLRKHLGSAPVIMVDENFGWVDSILNDAGRAARGIYLATTDVMPDARRTPAGERFATDFGPSAYAGYVAHAAQAAEIVLQAIGRSDGTRASVLRELRATRVRDGIIGTFAFDRNGDMVPATVSIMRVIGNTPRGVDLPFYLEGAVVDRVVEVPASLAS
jgi:ABC-type branched-subunit amino acid transport system substrate-binding protein/streptogramin lyase/tRNA A-37 threonylcarbamoyl transferase component Bud32